jgi:hypothetical protein
LPPRPPLANSAKIELGWTGPEGAQATNILYCLGSSSLSAPETLTSIAGLFLGTPSPIDDLLPFIAPSWSLSELRVIDNSGASENVIADDPNYPGQGTNPALPPNCAVCISWPIAAHYRGGHPRMYLPGVQSAAMEDPGGKDILATVRDGLENFGQDLITAFAGAAIEGVTSLALGTISYYAGKVLRSLPLFRPYLGAEVGARLDSQRRRLGKEPALVS